MPIPLLAPQLLKKKARPSGQAHVLALLLAGGLGAGAFFGIRALVKRAKRNAREGKALEAGNPANYALHLAMAFENDNGFGWGTDEELVFRTLEEIPSAAMMRKVQRAYKDMEGRNLSADLKSELSIEEFALANQIINLKR